MIASGNGRVVVLGSLNTDIFARVDRHPAPGETIIGHGGESRPGGKGANQAAAAALCGAPVSMVGAVGGDAHSATALSILEEVGCDCSAVRRVDGPTGIALITVDAAGENSIIVIPGANAEVGEPELEALGDLGTRDLLVLQGEVPVETCAAAAHRATEMGSRVIVNLAPVVPYPAETLRLANPLVVNEHEAQGALRILGSSCDESPEAVAQALTAAGVPSVVMTLGSKGAVVADPLPTLLPAEAVEAVDTTGAGDAFVGALAAALMSGKDIAEAAKVASRFAAQSVLSEGAQDSYPDWRNQ